MCAAFDKTELEGIAFKFTSVSSESSRSFSSHPGVRGRRGEGWTSSEFISGGEPACSLLGLLGEEGI